MPSKFEARLRALEAKIKPHLPPPLIVSVGDDGLWHGLDFSDGGPGPAGEVYDPRTVDPARPVLFLRFVPSDGDGRPLDPAVHG